MRRRALLLGAPVWLVACGDAATPPAARRGDTVAVVFESGLGDGGAVWRRTRQHLGPRFETFAYARPGYRGARWHPEAHGDTDGRRSGSEIAHNLRLRLRDAGMPPPYILVGHSVGGLYAQAFLARYPGEVRGLVLVDGRPVGFTAACEAVGAGLCRPPALVQAAWPAHQRAEVAGLDATAAALAGAAPAAVPTVVLAATEPDVLTSRAFQDLWLAHQRRQARRLGARFVAVPGATHYIQVQRPEIVAEAIRSVADMSA